jgi:hypothetical protein
MDSWAVSSLASTLGMAGASLPAMLAYIDPGTGSLVFQIVVAGLLTAAMMLRNLRERLMGVLGKLVGRGGKDPSSATRIATDERKSETCRHPSSVDKKSRAA